MSADLILNDDDLTLYALHLLTAEESEQITRRLGQNVVAQQRLAAIQLSLGMFAESTVEMQEVPRNSLSRLLQSIDDDQSASVQAISNASPRETTRRWSILDLLPWAGWAVAAALVLLVIGRYLPRESQLRGELASAKTSVTHSVTAQRQLDEENTALKAALQQRTEQALTTQSIVSDAERQAAALRAKADAALAEAAKQGGKASDLALVAAATSRERDALKGQLNAQSAQNAQIAAQSAEAQRVLGALSDASALRVTLTVPKKKPSPSGRGAYLASTGALVFIGSNLPIPKGNKVYELWLMPADGSAPLPAGTFVPDAAGNATVVNSKFRQNVPAKGFAVTIENQGGSQTPTLPIVLAGA